MIRTSEELRKDIERLKKELLAVDQKETVVAPIVRDTIKKMNEAKAEIAFRLSQNGLSEKEIKEVIQSEMEKMGFGFQTIPEKKQTVKAQKAKTVRHVNYGPTPRAKVNGLGVPTPEACIQCAVVLLADKFGMTGRQLKQFVEDCGKKETLSMARTKFKKYDPTGKLWQKQCIAAMPYVSRYGRQIANHYAHIK